MPDAATHWLRVLGDGLIYDGPCIVKFIIFWPDANADYADIYDGWDAASGVLFCRIEAAAQTTRHIGLGQGVRFGQGIYVDGIDAAVATTVGFVPLE